MDRGEIKPGPSGLPAPIGRWIGLGLIPLLCAMGLLVMGDLGTVDQWAGSLEFGLAMTAGLMLLAAPVHMVVALVTALILKSTRCSPRTMRGWILGPPRVLLLAVILQQLNRLRPSVAFERIVGEKAPPSLRGFHSVRTSALMSDRAVAWFEIDPADVDRLVSAVQMVPTNQPSLSELLAEDVWLRRADLGKRLPEGDYSRVFVHHWSELNFRDDQFLFTSPSHDRVVWVHRYDH